LELAMGDPSDRSRVGRTLWALGYVAVLGLIAWGVVAARQRTVRLLGTPEALRAWQDFQRQERERAAQQGQPVRRRVPTSPEPPALVLMRDYFGVILAGALVIGSAFYLFVWYVARGMAAERARRSKAPREP
jgi:hypothetical protein